MYRFAIIALILSFVLVTACSFQPIKQNEDKKSTVLTKKGDVQKRKASAPKKVKTKLDVLREKLQLTPLIEQWHHKIDGEQIRRLYLLQDLLLVETKKHRLYGFDRKTGIPKWVYSVGDPVDFKPAISKAGKIYILSMGKLHALSKSGKLLLKRELTFAPSSPPYATDKYVYIGGWDNFLYSIDVNTGFRDWRYRIDGDIWATPVEIDGFLMFCSTDKNVYAINAQSGATLDSDWKGGNGRFTTFGANVANPIVVNTPPELYVGSRDYNLYNINRITGALNWKFESGGEINSSPLIVSTAAYIVSKRDNGSTFFAIDTETGKEKWSVKNGNSFYFQGKYHVWVFKNNKRLIPVEPETGKVRGAYDLSAFDRFVSNVSDDFGFIGYMATTDGYLFAVAE